MSIGNTPAEDADEPPPSEPCGMAQCRRQRHTIPAFKPITPRKDPLVQKKSHVSTALTSKNAPTSAQHPTCVFCEAVVW